ncbi:uncharacterized protein ColSpa_04973 [Colletotrichum spaethianum]|uniref:Uncharacterized protein n=1 Tax=Colletotrichum spaethianum TaxID=700344 RepID=A0AA37LAD2_9PEZI|nr:uncharacterized protein ColSpa_04973 [Colletotrichum spaethianum]GKT44792.1 hypothetical protein ColSpa_04973 [Colletotrichum spaethianum]
MTDLRTIFSAADSLTSQLSPSYAQLLGPEGALSDEPDPPETSSTSEPLHRQRNPPDRVGGPVKTLGSWPGGWRSWTGEIQIFSTPLCHLGRDSLGIPTWQIRVVNGK